MRFSRTHELLREEALALIPKHAIQIGCPAFAISNRKPTILANLPTIHSENMPTLKRWLRESTICQYGVCRPLGTILAEPQCMQTVMLKAASVFTARDARLRQGSNRR